MTGCRRAEEARIFWEILGVFRGGDIGWGFGSMNVEGLVRVKVRW